MQLQPKNKYFKVVVKEDGDHLEVESFEAKGLWQTSLVLTIFG